MKYCCEQFKEHFNQQNKNDTAIKYYHKTRSFFLHSKGENIYPAFYCPWCGTKLPSDLSDKWWDVLEEEYGINDPRGDDEDRVPPEFKTDEWWKKRGL